jgi:Protein of unknown function (DUF3807)
LPTTLACPEAQQVEEHYENEEDDGLGYYPDGVKRTLSDEQVAIFRHSEFQRIMKMVRARVAEIEAAELEETPLEAAAREAAELEAAELKAAKLELTTLPHVDNGLAWQIANGLDCPAQDLVQDKDKERHGTPTRVGAAHSPKATVDLEHTEDSGSKLFDSIAAKYGYGPGGKSMETDTDVNVADQATVLGKRKCEPGQHQDQQPDESQEAAESINVESSAQNDTLSVVSSEFTTTTRSDVPEYFKSERTKKRKKRRKPDPLAPAWHDKNEFLDEADENGHTFRRKARELDAQKAETLELDY